LTGNFEVTGISSAASTGMMDLRSGQWCAGMLGALKNEEYRKLAWQQLPRIVDHFEPIGALSESLALEAGLDNDHRPLIFPTSDDQQAGLIGGGAVDAGQVAIILGIEVLLGTEALGPAYERLDVVPVDIWIARILRAMHKPTTSLLELEKFSNRQFGSYAGYVQQYLFHHARMSKTLPA
jgi:sugar (pentulose or hexulose) kinase